MNNNRPGRSRARDIGFYALLIVILLAVILTMNQGGQASQEIPYSEARELFLKGEVAEFSAEGNVLNMTLRDGSLRTCALSTISIFYNDLYVDREEVDAQGEPTGRIYNVIQDQFKAGTLKEYNYPPE